MSVVWLFLTMPWVCLQFVIVVFPDHTHIFFYLNQGNPYVLFAAFVMVNDSSSVSWYIYGIYIKHKR